MRQSTWSVFDITITLGEISNSLTFGGDVFADLTVGGAVPIPVMTVDGGIYGNFSVT